MGFTEKLFDKYFEYITKNDNIPKKYKEKNNEIILKTCWELEYHFDIYKSDIYFINSDHIIVKCKEKRRNYYSDTKEKNYEILEKYGYTSPYKTGLRIVTPFNFHVGHPSIVARNSGLKYDPFYIIENKYQKFYDYDSDILFDCSFDRYFWEIKKFFSDITLNGSENDVKELFAKDEVYPIDFIENEEELDGYYNSQFDYWGWRSNKVTNKMKEYGLGDTFIKSFSNRIDTLEKYNEMIDLANEIEDKNLFMSLFVEKFKEAEE